MRSAADERYFAESASGAFGVDDVLSRSFRAYDAHASLEHDPPSARFTAGEEEHLVGPERHLDRPSSERRRDAWVGVAEKLERGEGGGRDHSLVWQEMRPRLLLTICALGAGVFGCGDGPVFPTGAPPRAAVTTDSLGYTARVVGDYFGHPIYQFRIIARYENTSSRRVVMIPCTDGAKSPLWSIALTDGDDPKKSAFNPGWSCTGTQTLIGVEPGAVRVDTFVVRGPTRFDGVTHEPFEVIQGRMRLGYAAAWDCGSDLCPLPDSLSLTNEFAVRVER
jgi:hypothetical protein